MRYFYMTAFCVCLVSPLALDHVRDEINKLGKSTSMNMSNGREQLNSSLTHTIPVPPPEPPVDYLVEEKLRSKGKLDIT